MNRNAILAAAAASIALATGILATQRHRPSSLEQATKLEIYALRSPHDTKHTGQLRLRFVGEAARQHAARFNVETDFCNLCLSPDSQGWYRFQFSRDSHMLRSVDVHLRSGQVTPYDHGCLWNLSEASRLYFATLLQQAQPRL